MMAVNEYTKAYFDMAKWKKRIHFFHFSDYYIEKKEKNQIRHNLQNIFLALNY